MKGSGPQGPPAFVPHTTANSMEPVNWATPTPWAAERALGQQGISSWGSVGGGSSPRAPRGSPCPPCNSSEVRGRKAGEDSTSNHPVLFGANATWSSQGEGEPGQTWIPSGLGPKGDPQASTGKHSMDCGQQSSWLQDRHVPHTVPTSPTQPKLLGDHIQGPPATRRRFMGKEKNLKPGEGNEVTGFH